MKAITPLISICCITFNHSKYIKDAIEGFLMQKTTFKYEILIHDDASTDGTEEIIKEYESKYYEIIEPLYEIENQWKKRIYYNPVFNYPRASGKYIALCEGDDYWTDPYKLQKQVNFLEQNPEYSMCFHGAKIISEINNLNDSLCTDLEERDYSSDELLKTWTVPTASIVFRREFVNRIPQSKKFMFGDIISILTMAEHGKVRCINEVMSVYRRTKTGVVLSQNINSSYYFRMLDHYKEIYRCFSKISKPTIDKLIINQCVGICTSYLKRVKLRQFVYNYFKFFMEYRTAFFVAFASAVFYFSQKRLRDLNKTP